MKSSIEKGDGKVFASFFLRLPLSDGTFLVLGVPSDFESEAFGDASLSESFDGLPSVLPLSLTAGERREEEPSGEESEPIPTPDGNESGDNPAKEEEKIPSENEVGTSVTVPETKEDLWAGLPDEFADVSNETELSYFSIATEKAEGENPILSSLVLGFAGILLLVSVVVMAMIFRSGEMGEKMKKEKKK